MLYRKIYQDLLKWKNSKDRNPLIIKGLRQIGKSTIAESFAINEYGKENYALLDFRKNESLKKIFDGDFNIDEIIFQLRTIFKETKFIPYNTLLIFDEIQDCPNARSCLKYFKQDGRYDVIGTGSFLGIKDYYNAERGIPVGYEEHIVMKPLDFEEFLLADDVSEEMIALLRECVREHKALPEFLHLKMLNEFKTYIWVGGMPKVVLTYLETKDPREVRKVQKNLIAGYVSDFGTHLGNNLIIKIDEFAKTRINQAFASIPRQLAKENQKFSYNEIIKNAKGREYKSAIDWLCDYGLTCKCHNLSITQLPLESFAIDDQYKLFIADSGLYMAMLNESIVDEFLTNKLFISKGAIFENMFVEASNKLGKPLYYFKKDSGLEIDFVINGDGQAVIVEIKAKSGRTKSASTVLSNYDKYHVNNLIVFNENNITYSKTKITYPYYLISFVLEE